MALTLVSIMNRSVYAMLLSYVKTSVPSISIWPRSMVPLTLGRLFGSDTVILMNGTFSSPL
jgi:hypothetical protein